MENFWRICLEHLEGELSAQQFNTWIKPLHFELKNDTLCLTAPNKFVLQWVKERFLLRIETIAKELFHDKAILELTLAKQLSGQVLNAQKIHQQNVVQNTKNFTPLDTIINREKNSDFQDEKMKVSSHNGNRQNIKTAVSKVEPFNSGLNSSFNFDNFITGRANQLARAAAIQVAENPGNAYNPLFIYGGVGLGKTHLLQAIGNHLKQQNPDTKIRYLHAERYVSDVVKAYENKAFDDFKRQYHSLDILLIDDIQFFSKKNRTQDEFFFAFNALIEAKKQIVITCDTYPKEIADMEDRLRTRFSWGLTVAVEPPELEMRVAILLKKAEGIHIKLNEEVAFFVAKQVRSSVRELEGALNRIVAMAKFTGHAIDIHLAKEALKDLIAVRGRLITIENIQKTVADYYKIKVAEMYSKKRARNFARPRQIAMSLTRELTNHSFPEIGDAFGSRHHTTVMHACDEIEHLKQNDPGILRDIGFLIQVIRD